MDDLMQHLFEDDWEVLHLLEEMQIVPASLQAVGYDHGAGPSSATEMEAEVPDEFVCPITSEIMADPVVTADGFTFERSAIEKWLETHDTSPKTGLRLEFKVLFPNQSLRIMIREFQEAQE